LPIVVTSSASDLVTSTLEFVDGMEVVDWNDVATQPTMAAPAGLTDVTLLPDQKASATFTLPWDYSTTPTVPAFGFTLGVTDEDAASVATMQLGQGLTPAGMSRTWPYRGWGLAGDTGLTMCNSTAPLAYSDFSGKLQQGTVEVLCSPTLNDPSGSSETWVRLLPNTSTATTGTTTDRQAAAPSDQPTASERLGCLPGDLEDGLALPTTITVINSLNVPVLLTAANLPDAAWTCRGGSPANDTPEGFNGLIIAPGESVDRRFFIPYPNRRFAEGVTFELTTNDVSSRSATGSAQLGLKRPAGEGWPFRSVGMLNAGGTVSCTGTSPLRYPGRRPGWVLKGTMGVQCGQGPNGGTTIITLLPSPVTSDNAAQSPTASASAEPSP
jgi:hypothetical protein